MKLVFDTSDPKISNDPDILGGMLNLFLKNNGGHPHLGRDPNASGWTKVTNTPRPLLVALMGNDIYEGCTANHIRHDATDLEVLWYVDGDLVLMYHHAEEGFTIVNSHHGLGDNWYPNDLQDPRNDPEHDPFVGLSDCLKGILTS